MHLSNFSLVVLKVVFILSSSVASAQTVSLDGNLGGMDYSAKISYQHDCFLSEPLTRATLHSVYINSFTYNGKTYRGNDLEGVSFPIKVEDGYLRVKGRVRIDRNSYVNLPPKQLSLSIGGGGHAVMADAFHIPPEELKSLGMKQCDEWIPRAHEIGNLQVLDGGFSSKRSMSWKSDLENLVQQKLEEEEEKRLRKEKLMDIQKQIEQTDDPDEKIALLKKSREYSDNPGAIDAEIQRIQDQKRAISNSDSNTTDNGNGNRATSVASNEEDSNQQKETDQKTPEQERIEQQIRDQNAKIARLEAQNEAYAEAASIAAEGLATGISEGIITGLSLSYNMRSTEAESPIGAIPTVLRVGTYELGIQMGKNANSGFSVGYGPGGDEIIYDTSDSYTYVVGLDIGILNLLEFGNSYGFQLSVGGEYGSGSGTYTDSTYNGDDIWDVTDDVSFYGGHINAKIMKFIVGGYGYGLANGSTTSNGETTEYELPYSKVTLGLRIPF